MRSCLQLIRLTARKKTHNTLWAVNSAVPRSRIGSWEQGSHVYALLSCTGCNNYNYLSSFQVNTANWTDEFNSAAADPVCVSHRLHCTELGSNISHYNKKKYILEWNWSIKVYPQFLAGSLCSPSFLFYSVQRCRRTGTHAAGFTRSICSQVLGNTSANCDVEKVKVLSASVYFFGLLAQFFLCHTSSSNMCVFCEFVLISVFWCVSDSDHQMSLCIQ